MVAFTDSDGTPLSGGGNYRLNLPANIPAANFWSLTLYEAENASGLANRRPFPSLGSRDKPAQNTDGSTDLYLGPKPPEGKGANWLATVPGKGYFAILRLYSPTEAAIDKSWAARLQYVGSAPAEKADPEALAQIRSITPAQYRAESGMQCRCFSRTSRTDTKNQAVRFIE